MIVERYFFLKSCHPREIVEQLLRLVELIFLLLMLTVELLVWLALELPAAARLVPLALKLPFMLQLAIERLV